MRVGGPGYPQAEPRSFFVTSASKLRSIHRGFIVLCNRALGCGNGASRSRRRPTETEEQRFDQYAPIGTAGTGTTRTERSVLFTAKQLSKI